MNIGAMSLGSRFRAILFLHEMEIGWGDARIHPGNNPPGSQKLREF